MAPETFFTDALQGERQDDFGYRGRCGGTIHGVRGRDDRSSCIELVIPDRSNAVHGEFVFVGVGELRGDGITIRSGGFGHQGKRYRSGIMGAIMGAVG